MFYSLPDFIRPELLTNNRQELTFVNGSSISCQTCGNKDLLRGATCNGVLHISEFALYKNQEQQMQALMQAVTETCTVIVESTTKGFNMFTELYMQARNGENDFKSHFFNWINGRTLFLPQYELAVKSWKAKITGIDVITEDEIKALFTSEGLATTSYVDTAVSNVPATDLSNYYTKSEVDALLSLSDEGGTDSGETDKGDETSPIVTGTSSISGNTTLKVGYNRSYTGSFLDADGNTVSDVIGTWTISDCTFASDIEQTIADNKITLYTENEDIIDEAFTLTFSDPNGNYTSSSVTITVGSAF